MRIGVFGLGKLGAPMVALFAKAGHEVLGYDVMPGPVSALSQGKAPVEETNLQETLDSAQGQYRATTDPAIVVRWADIIFIVVPTPSEIDGSFTTQYVREVCNAIGDTLTASERYQLIVLVSTVMPGTVEKVIIPLLESRSNRTCGVDFGVCYNPEFIALGSVIENMLHPDFVLIGESCQKDGEILEAFYHHFYDAMQVSHPPICRMSLVNAEITKLSVNAYLTTKISYANQLAALCDAVPGADAWTVTSAVGLDSRIGIKYLKPTAMYGGPCLPRDSRALARAGKRVRISLPLAEATIAVNREWPHRIADIVMGLSPKVVAILGLTYKPFTHLVEESAGVNLLRCLRSRLSQTQLRAYDPQAKAPDITDAIRPYLVYIAETIESCLKGCDVAVITTPWPEFRALRLDFPITVLDCWQILDPAIQGPDVRIIYPGKCRTCPS